MIISFQIEYHTNWGEEIRVVGSIPELGTMNVLNACALSTTNGKNWSTSIEINISEQQELEYYYCLFKDNQLISEEWNYCIRKINIIPSYTNYNLLDFWRNIPAQQPFYSSAFTRCFHSRNIDSPSPSKEYKKNTLRIKVLAPDINQNYSLAISGNQEILGNWNSENIKLLNASNYPEWQIELDANQITSPLNYKFLLYNVKEERVVQWENGPDRQYEFNETLKENELTQLANNSVSLELPLPQFAGVAIPIFSLRSQNSLGIGDFGDLKKMIDWAIRTGQKIIQILPINDTTMSYTWKDSYPYNSISIYALHPLYLDIHQLGQIREIEKASYFAENQKRLNDLPLMDYEEVSRVKWEFFRHIYQQEGKEVLQSPEFISFFEKNKDWLQPYALFSYLRDIYKTPDFRKWPKYMAYDREETEKLLQPDSAEYEDIAIYYYLQYHLHCQLLAASNYARENHIVLKGDIPIGISRNSVEAWIEPHYFNMNGQAGAPPDDFAVNGQNWGFPTYNWEVMEKDGYSWWIKRFQKLGEYFDAYRIDHILGFMRIWEIPMHAVHGLLGQFTPSLPMTIEEIESYGLEFNKEFFLKPYIHENILFQLFGEKTNYIKDTFLLPISSEGRYELKPEFNTQRKVESYFIDKSDIESIQVRDKLYTLISNVLFLEDHRDPTKYHPRIAVQKDFIFQTLTQEHQEAFNRLYENYYYHRHNEFWYRQAMKKLPQLTKSNHMLVCGEDLGMIPASLKTVMNDLRILNLEIQRMPKEFGVEFGNPGNYPYHSVSTISTHDMSNLRGWWKENPGQTQRYFNTMLKRDGVAPQEASGELCQQVITQHLTGTSMLCILAWQDWLSVDEQWRNPEIQMERINIPADPGHYWRYRMHLTLEELMNAESVNNKITSLIDQSKRN